MKFLDRQGEPITRFQWQKLLRDKYYTVVRKVERPQPSDFCLVLGWLVGCVAGPARARGQAIHSVGLGFVRLDLGAVEGRGLAA